MNATAQAWCAVLAAGQGARFGGGKLSADLAGRPLLLWAVEAALAAGPGRVLVVLGAGAEELRGLLPADPRLEVLVNSRHQEGMGTSLARAAQAALAGGAEVLAVLLADMPLVAPATVAAVARAARRMRGTCWPRPGGGWDRPWAWTARGCGPWPAAAARPACYTPWPGSWPFKAGR
ncbi:MAG: NTP transferase domain-containing protein [Desulfarculus sp.]|nr:NTP transferase domain-containing protein [Desulfarculus sp.]